MTTLADIESKAQSSLDKSRRSLADRPIRSYRRDKGGDNWMIFCIFYLEALNKLIQDLPETPEADAKFDPKRALIVPTFFLFRHTFELFLKLIQISFVNEVGSHDIEEIRKKIQFKHVSKLIKWNEVAKALKLSEAEAKIMVSNQFETIELFIENYYFGLYLFDEFKNMNFILVDKQNELFKYPITNNVSLQIDPLSLYGASPNTIKKLKKDVKKLNTMVDTIEIVIVESGLLPR